VREKRQFLSIAQGSLAELNTQLTLCGHLGWLPARQLAPLFALEQETGSMLTALRRHFRKSGTTTS
jgi:four helix bundle protein